jgi:hypothetical protein
MIQTAVDASTRGSRVLPLLTSVCVSQGMEASCVIYARPAPTALVAQEQTALPVVVLEQLPATVPPAPPSAAANLALEAANAM